MNNIILLRVLNTVNSDLKNDKRQCINISCGKSERYGNGERKKRFITNTKMETNAKQIYRVLKRCKQIFWTKRKQ